jgi:hypothetical protein
MMCDGGVDEKEEKGRSGAVGGAGFIGGAEGETPNNRHSHSSVHPRTSNQPGNKRSQSSQAVSRESPKQ